MQLNKNKLKLLNQIKMYFYIKILEQGHQCDQNKPNNKLSFFQSEIFFYTIMSL